MSLPLVFPRDLGFFVHPEICRLKISSKISHLLKCSISSQYLSCQYEKCWKLSSICVWLFCQLRKPKWRERDIIPNGGINLYSSYSFTTQPLFTVLFHHYQCSYANKTQGVKQYSATHGDTQISTKPIPKWRRQGREARHPKPYYI